MADSVDPTYARVEDVQRVMQSEFHFDDNSTPSKEDVESILLEAETIVEQETGHAWQEKTVTNEYHDIPEFYPNFPYRELKIKLDHRKIKPFDGGEGDKIEVWNGNEYVDYVDTKIEGRGSTGDYWVNYEDGEVYIQLYSRVDRKRAFRITYRFGETTVPRDIRQATALLAASLLLQSDDRIQLVSDTNNPLSVSHDQRANNWRKRATRILRNRAEFTAIGY